MVATATAALDWQARVLCAQVDPEVFFPEKGQSARAAKWICGRCPVREACLDYAIAGRVPFGVWGGLSTSERERLYPPVAPKSHAPHRPRPDAAFRSPLVDCPCGAPTCRKRVAKATRNEHLRRLRAAA
jgi:hypothetical protein